MSYDEPSGASPQEGATVTPIRGTPEAGRDGERWAGGYIRTDSKGRRIYYLHKRVQGHLFHISLRTTSQRTAFAHLERFERDPVRFRVDAGTGREQLRFTDELRDAYLAHAASPDKKNSTGWLGQKRRYIAWWQARLEGKDLRQLDLKEIRAHLEGATCRPHRTAVIKDFLAWLRRDDKLLAHEDPTLHRLPVPSGSPAQWDASKASSKESIRAVISELGEAHWADALTVQANTGWHLTELRRFVHTGRVECVAGSWVLHMNLSKGGEPLRSAIPEAAVAAAKRLRGRGSIDLTKYRLAVHEASDRVKVPRVYVGSMRHTAATWMVNAGASMTEVATFLGHKSPATTRRWYAVFVAPKRPVGLLD